MNYLTKKQVSGVVPSFEINSDWDIIKHNQRIQNKTEFKQHSYLMAAMSSNACDFFKTYLQGKKDVLIEHFIFKFLVCLFICLFFFC